MLWIGPGKLKSNPILARILASKSINYYFDTRFFSSGSRRFIIRVKLGEIGYSNFAERSTQITDR
tara:strand:- start:874 stop:1068 length:195 start_codon:yes stop_codon:yes gene_type:complete